MKASGENVPHTMSDGECFTRILFHPAHVGTGVATTSIKIGTPTRSGLELLLLVSTTLTESFILTCRGWRKWVGTNDF
jgi:hypothetical protein